MFKPFTSAGDDHHKNFGGTGLGLWISKVIVELMGGKVQCRSEHGVGSVFQFQLPIQFFKGEEPNSPHPLNLKSIDNVNGG